MSSSELSWAAPLNQKARPPRQNEVTNWLASAQYEAYKRKRIAHLHEQIEQIKSGAFEFIHCASVWMQRVPT